MSDETPRLQKLEEVIVVKLGALGMAYEETVSVAISVDFDNDSPQEIAEKLLALPTRMQNAIAEAENSFTNEFGKYLEEKYKEFLGDETIQ